LGRLEANITEDPVDLTALTTTKIAVQKALSDAELTIDDIGLR